MDTNVSPKLERPVFKKLVTEMTEEKIRAATFYRKTRRDGVEIAGFALPRKQRRELARKIAKQELKAWRQSKQS